MVSIDTILKDGRFFEEFFGLFLRRAAVADFISVKYYATFWIKTGPKCSRPP